MKIISAYWEPIVQLNCSCIGGNEYIQFQRDKSFHENLDKEAYYVEFVDKDVWPFNIRFKEFIKYRKDWKNFIDKAEQVHNGIYFKMEQLSEFYAVLYNDAQQNEIIVSEDINNINSWKPKDKFEKYLWSDNEDESYSDWIFFKSKDNLVLSATIVNNEIISDFKFSWALPSDITKKDIKKYTRKFLLNPKYFKYPCQTNELFLYKDDIVNLFSVINYILNNTTQEEKGYKLQDEFRKNQK